MKILLTSLVALLEAVVEGQRVGNSYCACPRNYDPVCANGQTYSNPCFVRCAFRGNTQYVKAFKGECRRGGNNNGPRSNPIHNCICIALVDPVCGSDGRTYSNPCQLQCAAGNNNKLVMAYKGTCRVTNQCVCPTVFNPVCGSDGRNYSSPCDLRCAAPSKFPARLVVAYKGVCRGEHNTPRPGRKNVNCVCPTVIDPVCGTDRRTYPSLCDLECEAVFNSRLWASYRGACNNHHEPTSRYPGVL